MIDVYEEIRSALAAGDEGRACELVVSQRSSERWVEVREYARGLGLLEAMAEHAQWQGVEHGLPWRWPKEWALVVGGEVVADQSLDLTPYLRRWALVPARAVLPIWEESDWARGHPEHYGAPRRAIEMAEANLRGEATEAVVEVARKASDAGNVARDAARDGGVAYAVTYAAWAAADAAVGYAAGAAWAAAADRDDLPQSREEWAERWTAWLVGQMLGGGGSCEPQRG